MHESLNIPSEGLYLYFDDETQGPFSLDRIRELFEAEKINRSTFLWFDGLENWVAVGDIPEFDRRDILHPPPLPKSTVPSSLWVYHKKQVVTLTVSQIRTLVNDKQLRRSDFIYSDSKKAWVRADQHASTKDLFNSPAKPVFAEPTAKLKEKEAEQVQVAAKSGERRPAQKHQRSKRKSAPAKSLPLGAIFGVIVVSAIAVVLVLAKSEVTKFLQMAMQNTDQQSAKSASRAQAKTASMNLQQANRWLPSVMTDLRVVKKYVDQMLQYAEKYQSNEFEEQRLVQVRQSSLVIRRLQLKYKRQNSTPKQWQSEAKLWHSLLEASNKVANNFIPWVEGGRGHKKFARPRQTVNALKNLAKSTAQFQQVLQTRKIASN